MNWVELSAVSALKSLTFNLLPEMAEGGVDLPDECWELIINRVSHPCDLESLSMVCKRFFSITNRMRISLPILNKVVLMHGTVSNLLHRFRGLKFIDLSQFRGDLDCVFREIAHSDLNLEALHLPKFHSLPLKDLYVLGSRMKNLRVLRCAQLSVLRDLELAAIANSLPGLEELDISHDAYQFDSEDRFRLVPFDVNVSDRGIELLSSKLTNLRKINLSGHHFVTDQSLRALTSNCLLLGEIVVTNCTLITANGIHFIMRHCPNLTSLSVDIPPGSSLPDDPLCFPRALHTIEFYDLFLSDEFLYTLGKARLLLTSLTLYSCIGFTLSGFSSLFHTYQSIECLSFGATDILTDHAISDLSQYLHKLVSVKFHLCYKLTGSTFFTLARNCPLLETVEMVGTTIQNEDCSMDSVRSTQIKSLSLELNEKLNDEFLRKFASVCPRLELLILSCCSKITGRGIAAVLESCCEIKHLCIRNCAGIESIGMGPELPNLEVLRAAGSGIDDEGLAMTGRRCCGLLKLELDGTQVTTETVDEVVRSFRRLREISLNGCSKVSLGIIDWLVFSNPSLRIITPPRDFNPTENQKMLYLRHGCLVIDKDPRWPFWLHGH